MLFTAPADPGPYLDVLERKPGALAGSTALEQWRRAGRWPASFDVLWQRLIDRQGRQPGTRAMIAVIQLGKEFGHDALRQAVDTAVKLGCSDSSAVRYLLTCVGQRRPAPEAIEVGGLTRYDRPMPCLTGYDRRLDQDQETMS
jgi:hypothetical protein